MSSCNVAVRFVLLITVVLMLYPTLAAADDPHDDLVVRVPKEDPDGAVEWLFGTAAGLTDAHSTLFAGADQMMSSGALASGDFNGDLHTDLAIGMPFYGLPGAPQAGRVTVCFGDGNLLDPFAGPCESFTQQTLHPAAAAEPYESLGWALAVGDFDGDGFDDLVIGVPDDVSTDGASSAGGVHVVYGHATGLGTGQTQYLRQGHELGDTAEYFDRLGWALATGDFNADGYADLAIGVPEENFAGGIHLVYGSAAGLVTGASPRLSQADLLGPPEASTYDYFGRTLAAGDINGDGFDDLAITSPGESVSGLIGSHGVVGVVLGTSSGIATGNPSVRLFQGSELVGDEPEDGDFFGQSLVMGDFDGDGFADLAIGVPAEDLGVDAESAGQLHVLYGSAGGFLVAKTQIWYQGAGIGGVAEAHDDFSVAMTAGDFNGDGFDDLAAAADWEDVGSIENAGAVSIIYGSASGLTSAGDQLWHQDALDLAGACEAQDWFGETLTAMRSYGVFANGFESGSADAWQGVVRIWTCARELYASGDGCHCGCGAVDPDCADASAASCDVCAATGSCAALSGTGCSDIRAEHNAVCW